MSFTLATPLDFSPFPWMKYALQECGQREVAGKTHNNPRIAKYHTTVGHAKDDETPWCSAFANWCMQQTGLRGSGRANARSWLTWGKQCLGRGIFGCVVVFSRPPAAWQGHVAFYVGTLSGKIVVLGGNQKNSVCVMGYPSRRVLGYRWPADLPIPRDDHRAVLAAGQMLAGFAAA
jgi:uncharacterized protein (TIGR02594 family)